MRKIQDIESQITNFESQLHALSEQKGDAETALEDARRKYARGIVDAETDEQAAEHHGNVMALTTEHSALCGAVDLVQEDLEKAEAERDIVLLYKTEGKRHNDSKDRLEKSIITINRDIPKLAALVDGLSDAIRGAFTGVEFAASSLNGIASDLHQSLSLEDFLSGHLTAAGEEIRESLVDDIGNDLKDSVQSLDVPENLNFQEIQSLLERLPRWKATVETFTGLGLVRNQKQLAKPVSRRPSTQRIVVPNFPHSEAPERPRVPIPRFDRNKPHGRQRITP